MENVKMKISKNKKNTFFSHIPRITQPKNLVPMSKGVICSPLTDGQTDIHTRKRLQRAPFQVAGVFPSTYYQGSAQIRESRETYKQQKTRPSRSKGH